MKNNIHFIKINIIIFTSMHLGTNKTVYKNETFTHYYILPVMSENVLQLLLKRKMLPFFAIGLWIDKRDLKCGKQIIGRYRFRNRADNKTKQRQDVINILLSCACKKV